MARLLFRLGSGAYRRRGLVLALWLVVLAGAGVGAVTLSGETTSAFAIPGQESTIAQEKITEEFGAGAATARVVVRAPDGQQVTAPANARAVTELVGELNALPGVASASDPLAPEAPTVNRELTTAYSTVTYTAPIGGVGDAERTALLDAVADARAGGWTVEVSGEALQAPPHIGGVTEAVGVVIALLILALTYGSLVMAGMNLLTAAVGVGVGVAGITIATGFMDLNSTTPILATMLGLAVGIDYALFIINRYRQELRHGADVGTAIGTAVGTAGSAVVTAGITVVIALAGLAVAGIPFLTQMGIAAAATIVVAVLVAITLVPAVLGYLGRRALPRRQRATTTEVRERGVFRGWVGGVTRGRVPALVLSVVVLGLISIPCSPCRPRSCRPRPRTAPRPARSS